MGGIGNAHGKAAPGLDVLHGLVTLRQVQGHSVTLLHRPPSGVHHVYGAVLVVGGDHQHGHGEDPLGDIQFFSHRNAPLFFRIDTPGAFLYHYSQ